MVVAKFPRATGPPGRIAANDKTEQATTHPASKRKPEADGIAKVDDDNITKSNDSRTLADIAKTDRDPNGPGRGSDTSSPPKTPAKKLVSIDITFNSESLYNVKIF
jgi:hypothetical protein